MVICLERGADCLHIVQLMPLYPKHHLLPHLNPGCMVYLSVTGYTQTVLEKRPLNGYRPLVVAVKREKISELNFSVRKPKT